MFVWGHKDKCLLESICQCQVSSISLHFAFWDEGLSLDLLIYLTRLAWTASSQDLPVHFPSTQVTGICCHTFYLALFLFYFHFICESELRSSCFSDCAMSLALVCLYILDVVLWQMSGKYSLLVCRLYLYSVNWFLCFFNFMRSHLLLALFFVWLEYHWKFLRILIAWILFL